MIKREMGIWKRVNHPNIVPFLGVTYGFGMEGNASLVSLWMPNGTLHTFLENYDLYLTGAHRLKLVCYHKLCTLGANDSGLCAFFASCLTFPVASPTVRVQHPYVQKTDI